jgi:hypothetical protein
VALALFFAGMSLLTLNLYGLAVSLRPAELHGLLKSDVTLSYDEALRAKDRRAGEPAEAYVSRLTMLVNRSMAHIWDDAVTDRYHLRVPARENFVLYLRSFVTPSIYEKYEFTDYKKALERGVGLCSQQAMVLADILNENGVRADIVALEGHVVVRAEAERGRWVTADPDYGIVMPHDLGALDHDAALVRRHYRNVDALYVVDDPARVYGIPFPSFTDYLADIYGKEGNRVLPGGSEGYVPEQVRRFERFAYQLKWGIPILLGTPYLLTLAWRRRNPAASAAGRIAAPARPDPTPGMSKAIPAAASRPERA